MKSIKEQDVMLPPTPKKEVHNADFSFQQLSRRNFAYTTFIDCRFQGAALNHANLQYATFQRCDLTGAQFADANLAYSTFKECKYTDTERVADFTSADLQNVNFEGNTLTVDDTPSGPAEMEPVKTSEFSKVSKSSNDSTFIKGLLFLSILAVVFIIWEFIYN